MTIYIDIVLIENLIMNFIILLATGLILKGKISVTRLVIASLMGAIYSVVAYISILEIYSSMVLKIILSIVIIYIAFNPQTFKKMWKNLLIFYLTSFVFGGAAFALIYIVKPQDILMKNGLFLGTYPLKTIIFGAISLVCARSQWRQCSCSSGCGSLFCGGRHLTMLAIYIFSFLERSTASSILSSN